MKSSNRVSRVPEYIFSRIDDVKKELKAKGVSIIDLGIGDPDIPTPGFIVNTMQESVLKTKYHKYPPYRGIDLYKREVANYYERRFGVKLNPETEVAALIGSKEGIAHLFLAVTDPEDVVILPDPAYPVYRASALIAGCDIHTMNLLESTGFLPNIEAIDLEIARRAKLLVVNYPNNPTGAEADLNFFSRLIDFGAKNEMVIVNDGAYLEIGNEDYRPPSILQVEGAKDIAVEFGSLSKSYNMTGWRLGYVVGNKEVIDKLMVIKTNFDSGQFGALQEAGTSAIKNGDDFIKELNGIYSSRRRMVNETLRKLGIEVYEARSTFYVWFRVPQGFTSEEFASLVLEKTGVIITPGTAYGSQGEGYCRISLTVNEELLKEAVEKMCSLKY